MEAMMRPDNPHAKYFAGTAAVLFAGLFILHRRMLAHYRKVVGDIRTIDDTKVTFSLFSNLRHMIRIALPSVISAEGRDTLIFLLLFVARAWLSVWRSKADGWVIRAMFVKRHRFERLQHALLVFIGSSLFSAATLGCIEHVRFHLICAYRTKVTHYFHRIFFNKMVYYHAKVLDDRIQEADTCITHYCHEFAEHFAELPYYFLMPLFEAVAALIEVVREVGEKPALLMNAVVLSCLFALRYLSPRFGKIHAALLHNESEFRKLHTDVDTNIEQVAMHNAGEYTKNRLNRAYEKVQNSLEQMAVAKGHFTMLEGATTSTLWDAIGIWISAGTMNKGSGMAKENLGTFVVQRKLISNFFVAVREFVINIKELSHLSEFTEKLATFDRDLDNIAQGQFVRKPDPRFLQLDGSFALPTKGEYIDYLEASNLLQSSTNPSTFFSATAGNSTLMAALSEGWRFSVMSPQSAVKSLKNFPNYCTNPPKHFVKRPLVVFNFVDVCTPNGVSLIDGLTITIEYQSAWVIIGPNGCGKSSILRVLAGMWLPKRGSVEMHPDARLYCLPQAAYMLCGVTLAEQVCFPEEVTFFEGRIDNVTEKRIRQAMEDATAVQIIDGVIGGWEERIVGFDENNVDTTFDWPSLSGGQQQKIALARLFYHAAVAASENKMTIAVMDESTSQMDHEAERIVFANLKGKNITVISVSHRDAVLKHHTMCLSLTRNATEWREKPISEVLSSTQ